MEGAGGFHAGLPLGFVGLLEGGELLFELLNALFEGGDFFGEVVVGVCVELGGDAGEENEKSEGLGFHELALSRERGTSLRKMGAPSRPKASRSWFLR